MSSTDIYYDAVGNEAEVFKSLHRSKIPLLIKGPTGTGKSRFVEFMAATLNKQLITVACHEETSATDLIGRYLLKGNETVWVDGPMTKAVRGGHILYLDEIAEARPDIIVAIHSLTDHRRSLYIDKTGDTIPAHPEFMLVATYNPGYQKGYKELKPSTRQRFVSMSFDYPNSDREGKILINETGIDASSAKKLAKLGSKIRNLSELGLAETASTRLLVDAAKLMVDNIPPRQACSLAIAHTLTDEPETIEAIDDMISLTM